MAVLIRAKDAQGRTVSRCDANCYDAVGSITLCRCVCGGRNHRRGIAMAVKNTAAPILQDAIRSALLERGGIASVEFWGG